MRTCPLGTAISRVFHYLRDLPKPRPDTSGDGQISPVVAAFSGGLTGFYATGSPFTGLGGAAGGLVGLKVGEKTCSLTQAGAAAFAAGAGTTALSAAGSVLVSALLAGASVTFNPAGLAMLSTVGGLAGVGGMMQGNCVGSIKDSGIGGALTGAVMSGLGGSTLLPLVGSLAGAAGGVASLACPKHPKVVKVLVAGAVGAGLGAVAGAIQGPVGIVMNTVMGGLSGVIGSTAGSAVTQVLRNLTSDLQKLIFKPLSKLTAHMGIAGRTIMAGVGGAIEGIPLGMIGMLVMGPAGLVVPIVATGALTAFQVYRILKKREKVEQYRETMMGFLRKDFSQEAVNGMPEGFADGLASLFTQKYRTRDLFAKISQEQFREDVEGFMRAAASAQAAQPSPQETPAQPPPVQAPAQTAPPVEAPEQPAPPVDAPEQPAPPLEAPTQPAVRQGVAA